jgi:hypothetical protein
MKKTVGVEIDNTRRSRNSANSLPAIAGRWGVQIHAATADDGNGTITIGAETPTTDGGSSGSNIEADCVPPAPAVPINGDPRTDDEIGSGREVFERLTASGSSYVPTLRVDFYRAVWFDGLEAYQPVHYGLGTGKTIIPQATLASDVQVSARYVVK